MTRRIESIAPIDGMDGVFRVSYSNPLLERLRSGPVPIDELTALLTREYYDQNGIGSDFVTPPEFFPQTGNCYARFAIAAYEQMGLPDRFDVYEAGGGNGTLARGFMEEAATHPEFFAALTYHMIEQGEGLIHWQRDHMRPDHAERVVWHHEDVTQFVFPKTDAAMYIAMENDDDLPSKAVFKQNGKPMEVYLALGSGDPEEVVDESSPELVRFLADYPDWWSLVPERLNIHLPVHMASVRLRERFAASVSRGLMITTDYGYDLEESRQHMPNWVFPQYKAFEGNRKLTFMGSPFTSVLTRVGSTNYTANVDFALLALAGERAGFHTTHLSHHSFLDGYDMRSFVEHVFRTMSDEGSKRELVIYAKKLAYIAGVDGSDWKTLIQWKGFDMPPVREEGKLSRWFYDLVAQYQLGDVIPERMRGPAR